MARAAQNAAWCRTFAVLAQIFNANRDPHRSQALNPMDFYTWGEGETHRTEDEVSREKARREMRGLFGKKKA